MAPEKKNDFLDTADSEDENDVGYNSEEELRKGGRSAKRRKLDSDDSDNSDNDDLASDVEEAASDDDAADDAEDDEEEADEADEKPSKDGADDDSAANPQKKKRAAQDLKLTTSSDLPDITRPITKKNLVASEAAIKKSGVVYLSRIPPFMKPMKLRSLLKPYGTINRIFLAPEDPAARTRRIRGGGNKKKSYTEGWVEFVRKREAKAAAELLNARPIGGKKGSYYRDDIWNLLYLKGFKWQNLTEQIATENAERTSRMRAEISKSTKENKDFVRNVEKAKMLDGIHAKAAAKKKRKAATGDDDGVEDGNVGEGSGAAQREQGSSRTISFKQVPLAKKRKEVDEQPANVSRVLSKIF